MKARKSQWLTCLLTTTFFLLSLAVDSSAQRIAPSGGEPGLYWHQGSERDITWNPDDFKGPVNITLWNSETASYTTIATNVDAKKGHYTWDIPYNFPTGNGFRVKVQDASNYQMSTTFFTIHPKLDAVVTSEIEQKEGNLANINLELYPNPSSEYIKVEWNNSQAVKLLVYSLNGTAIISKQVEGQRFFEFSTTGLSTGTYILEIVLKDNTTLHQQFSVEK